MMASLSLCLFVSLAAPSWGAQPPDDVKAAAQKLADKPNYSWTAKVDPTQPQGGGQGGQRGRFGGGAPDGKTEKDGFTVLIFKSGDNTTEVVIKGDKAAIKEGDEWKTAEELADGGDGGANRLRAMLRRAEQFKAPATEAQELIGRVKELKKEGDTYSGELTADAIKQIYASRGRPGGGGEGNAPDTSGLKGTAKFWLKDGVLSKYENHVEGKMTGGRQNREIDVKRTTTIEIKDAGSTKVEVPPEARKKLNS